MSATPPATIPPRPSLADWAALRKKNSHRPLRRDGPTAIPEVQSQVPASVRSDVKVTTTRLERELNALRQDFSAQLRDISVRQNQDTATVQVQLQQEIAGLQEKTTTVEATLTQHATFTRQNWARLRTQKNALASRMAALADHAEKAERTGQNAEQMAQALRVEWAEMTDKMREWEKRLNVRDRGTAEAVDRLAWMTIGEEEPESLVRRVQGLEQKERERRMRE